MWLDQQIARVELAINKWVDEEGVQGIQPLANLIQRHEQLLYAKRVVDATP